MPAVLSPIQEKIPSFEPRLKAQHNIAENKEPEPKNFERESDQVFEEAQKEETEIKDIYLHLRRPWEQKILKFVMSDFVQNTLSNASNMLSFVGNTYASVMNLMPSVSKEKKQTAFDLGSLATKIPLFFNSTIGAAYQIISKRNWLTGIGQLIDDFNVFKFPFDRLYLGRGISYGLNVMGVALNRGARQREFKNTAEYFDSLLPGIKQTIKDFKNPLNYFNAESGMMCFINSIFLMLGSVIGLSGNLKLGASIRNTAGMIQDLDRLKAPMEQPKYFKSGICHLIGSVLNLAAKFVPGLERVFVPLGFVADTIGRDLFRQAQDRGEMVVKVKKSIFEIIGEKIYGKKPKSPIEAAS